MDMYENFSFYGGIQTVYQDEEKLTEKDRLLGAALPLLSWYEKKKRDLPWRRDRNPYRIWISEIMLQQTRVEAVKPYYFRFMEHFPDVPFLAEAKEEELLKCWEGLGYYSRARNLKKAAQMVMDSFDGVFPKEKKELLKLPGIGSYTAGAIASIAFGQPVPAVDGNVLRVLSRVLGSRDDILKQSTKRNMEELLEEVLDALKGKADPGDFNQALIETGAIVCVPNREPLCGECPFLTVCRAKKLGLIGEIPVKTPKKKRKIEEKTVLLLEFEDKIAIRKRQETGLLASLYEFPNLPEAAGPKELELFARTGAVLPLPDAKHVFSHTEWHMKGYLIHAAKFPQELSDVFDGSFVFVSWEKGKEQYPIPSAFAVYKKFLDERYGGNE